MQNDKRQADAIDWENVITPEMIEAGAVSLADNSECSATHLAMLVFQAMAEASPAFQKSPNPQSLIQSQ
jgi:hypothetical protein